MVTTEFVLKYNTFKKKLLTRHHFVVWLVRSRAPKICGPALDGGQDWLRLASLYVADG